jgi:hypothetical protein
MGIGNWFEFEGDGGAGMWVEGLDRRTPNISCHSGGRCIGMELTDITKSRRNEFNIMHLKELVGDEILVSVWLYLPADWQLHLTDGNWYQMVNPYFTDGDPWAPYAGISVIQDTGSPVFHLNVNWRDDDQQQYYLDDYPNFSLPRGRWFQVQYYVLRSPTNGILKIWFDGNLVANHTGLKTEGTVDEWFTTIAKIYYDTSDTFSPYRIWVDDLEIYNGEVSTITSVSLSAGLDPSSSTPTVLISGSIYPAPGGPVNVTLEFSNNQGGTYQEMSYITSSADGTFSYSWKAPGSGVFMIRADAQGVKSSPVSIGTSGVPGFPLESLLVGSALGLLFAIMRRRQRASRQVPHCHSNIHSLG